MYSKVSDVTYKQTAQPLSMCKEIILYTYNICYLLCGASFIRKVGSLYFIIV